MKILLKTSLCTLADTIHTSLYRIAGFDSLTAEVARKGELLSLFIWEAKALAWVKQAQAVHWMYKGKANSPAWYTCNANKQIISRGVTDVQINAIKAALTWKHAVGELANKLVEAAAWIRQTNKENASRALEIKELLDEIERESRRIYSNLKVIASERRGYMPALVFNLYSDCLEYVHLHEGEIKELAINMHDDIDEIWYLEEDDLPMANFDFKALSDLKTEKPNSEETADFILTDLPAKSKLNANSRHRSSYHSKMSLAS